MDGPARPANSAPLGDQMVDFPLSGTQGAGGRVVAHRPGPTAVIRSVKFWVLTVLLVGPVVVYVVLGAMWLKEHHWLLFGFLAWTAAALLFGVLSVRWTRAKGR